MAASAAAAASAAFLAATTWRMAASRRGTGFMSAVLLAAAAAGKGGIRGSSWLAGSSRALIKRNTPDLWCAWGCAASASVRASSTAAIAAYVVASASSRDVTEGTCGICCVSEEQISPSGLLLSVSLFTNKRTSPAGESDSCVMAGGDWRVTVL